jgi:outer membrane lipoprotein-sorting protein
MWFLKPGRMKWHYKEPEEQLFIVNDETVWFYQASEKQVIIDRFSRLLISELPVAFMMGLGNLKEDFTIKNACHGSDGLIFDLAPRKVGADGKQDDLSGFKLLVDEKTFLPKGATVLDVGGNTTAIVFGGIQTGVKLGEEDFKAEFPKGTDVNDQR